MILEGKRIAVFVADDYEDLEAWYPLLRMKEAGAEVKVIASDNVEGDSCLSKHGYSIDIDKKAANTNPEEYDAAIIPGGWAPDRMRKCSNTLDFIKSLSEKGKVIASICHGGWVLASADVISGKTLTSTSAIKDDLVNAGANWVDKEVVIDEELVTSRGPEDLPAFTKAIIITLAQEVCVICDSEYNNDDESWYYCAECESYYCPECVGEEELRQKTHEKQKQKRADEKKHMKSIENSSSVDEYKRLICPNCETEIGSF